MKLAIVRLFHDLLGTYGDQGNAEILLHRAKGRGIDVDLVEVSPGQIIPRSGDISVGWRGGRSPVSST